LVFNCPIKKNIFQDPFRDEEPMLLGTVEAMEFPLEIIEAFPELTKQEIDHLRMSL
jgi:hypothetical protein